MDTKPRDPVQWALDHAQRVRMPVHDGRMVIPPTMLSPGDSIVVDFQRKVVTVQRGGLVSAVLEPNQPI